MENNANSFVCDKNTFFSKTVSFLKLLNFSPEIIRIRSSISQSSVKNFYFQIINIIISLHQFN